MLPEPRWHQHLPVPVPQPSPFVDGRADSRFGRSWRRPWIREVVTAVTGATNEPHGPASTARLDFRLDPSVPTILDGAWWPRSRDAVTELVGLIIALDAEQAPVTLIMLNPDCWHGHPRRIEAAGRSVRVAWFVDLDTAVLIARTSYGRIDLLVQFDDDPHASALVETSEIFGGDQLASEPSTRAPATGPEPTRGSSPSG